MTSVLAQEDATRQFVFGRTHRPVDNSPFENYLTSLNCVCVCIRVHVSV